MTSKVMNPEQSVYLQGLRHNKLKPLLFGQGDCSDPIEEAVQKYQLIPLLTDSQSWLTLIAAFTSPVNIVSNP